MFVLLEGGDADDEHSSLSRKEAARSTEDINAREGARGSGIGLDSEWKGGVAEFIRVTSESPLAKAAMVGNIPILKRLLSSGASEEELKGAVIAAVGDIRTARTGSAESPSSASTLETLRLLFRAGAKPTWAALEQLASIAQGRERDAAQFAGCLDLFLRSGADLRITDSSCRTVLFSVRAPLAIREFARRGADVNARDRYGRTPLMLTPYLKVARALISAGADVDLKDNHGSTALMHSITNQLAAGALLELLLESGADPNLKDGKGRTALMYAAAEGGYWAGACLHVLLSHGARVDLRDEDGLTAEDHAALAREGALIKVLREHARPR